MNDTQINQTLDLIRSQWKDREAQVRPWNNRRGSAVLIPLVWMPAAGEWHVLFELRALDLDAQPGEVCFPGGRVEPGETPREAAVRETMEELLVSEDQIEVIAPLDALPGPGGPSIWPFLGILSDYENTWSEEEVDHTFTVPLSYFIETEPEVYDTLQITVPGNDFPFDKIPGGKDYPWKKRHYTVMFYKETDPLIWGITAKIIRLALEDVRGLLAEQ